MSLAATFVVPVAVAALSLAISLDLAAEDLQRKLREPRLLALALLTQLAALPLAVLALSPFMADTAVLAALLLVALVPSGPTSNYLAAVARGDVALAILMTLLGILLAVAVLPLLLPWLLERTGYALVGSIPPAGRLLQGLLGVVVLPLLAGLAITRLWPRQVRRWRPLVHRIAGAIFALLVLGALVAEWRTVFSIVGRAGLWVLAANLGAIGLTLAVARAARLAPPQVTTLALKCAVQNVSIAIALGLAVMDRTDVAAIAALYGAWQLLTASALALWRKPAA